MHSFGKIKTGWYMKKQKTIDFDIDAYEKALAAEHMADVDRLVCCPPKNSKINFNVVSKSGLTPLEIAFDIDEMERFGYTLDPTDNTDYRVKMLKRVDINYTNPKGQNLLHFIVCSKEHVCGSLFEKLVELGANPNLQDNEGNTPFHTAMMGNENGWGIHVDFMKANWVEEFWDPTIKNNLGRSPLFCAAMNIFIPNIYGLGYSHSTKLKELHWSPSEVDNNGNTVLHALALALGTKDPHYNQTIHLQEDFDISLYEEIGVDLYALNNDGKTFFDLLDPNLVESDVYSHLKIMYECVEQKRHLQEVLKDFCGDTIKRKI